MRCDVCDREVHQLAQFQDVLMDAFEVRVLCHGEQERFRVSRDWLAEHGDSGVPVYPVAFQRGLGPQQQLWMAWEAAMSKQPMKTWMVKGTARRTGALGIVAPFALEVEASTKELAMFAVYEAGYEHVTVTYIREMTR